jgi:hypothetical protein
VQSTVLRYLHESLGFKSFHLRWAPHLDRWFTPQTEGACKRSLAILLWCPTWWLALSCDWWWVVVCLRYIAMSNMDGIERQYGHKIEAANSDPRVYVYDYMQSQRLLCCRQTPKWYENEQHLFATNAFILLEEAAFFKEGCRVKDDLSFIAMIAQFTEVALQQIGLKNWYCPHATITLFT